MTLWDPYIVNGCQTTRTIWEVFHNKLSAGGTGINPETESWKARAKHGVVVVKIVKVGESGESLLQKIARYTNRQNAIREKDFLALTNNFREWQAELGGHYDLYLEIQRGGWDAQKALQDRSQLTKRFAEHANAADLIKVYGAAWLAEAGLAFGKNPPFLPGGAIYRRILDGSEADRGPFGAEDLYAAYLLQEATRAMEFGRGARKQSRRQTRFLFLMVVVDLLRDVLVFDSRPSDNRAVSSAIIKVLEDKEASANLMNSAAEVIDRYITQGEDGIFSEPAFDNFNADLNAFLKWEKLGKSEKNTPKLNKALDLGKRVMALTSARSTILAALSSPAKTSAGDGAVSLPAAHSG